MARKTKEKKKESFLESVSGLAVVLVTGLFIITFNLQAFEIPSSSMENTLLIGDHVFVDRTTLAPETKWVGPLLPYRDVKRGDIVVFLSPIEPGLHVVKRIVAVPGDRLRMEMGRLYLNGKPVEEEYALPAQPYIPYRDDFPTIPAAQSMQVAAEWRLMFSSYVENGELVVPPGRYFALGDNRGVSYDSRYWGFIPRENVIGRPMFIYWSFESTADEYGRTGIADRVGNILNVVIHFFDKTRWTRTLRPVR